MNLSKIYNPLSNDSTEYQRQVDEHQRKKYLLETTESKRYIDEWFWFRYFDKIILVIINIYLYIKLLIYKIIKLLCILYIVWLIFNKLLV